MTDETTPHSGSRWEPATVAASASAPDRPAPAPPSRAGGRPGARRRGVFLGAALGLVTATGLGGIALGHAVADGAGAPTGQVTQLRTSDDHPALPGGAVTPGTLPGQLSGGPGDDLADDDGDSGHDQDNGSGTTQPGSPT